MTTLHMPARAGRVTPESDEALGRDQVAQGFKGQESGDSGDFACKLSATASALAALIGMEVRRTADNAWMLRSAAGATIGTVQGLGALQAAVAGFEAVQDHLRDLLQQVGGAAR